MEARSTHAAVEAGTAAARVHRVLPTQAHAGMLSSTQSMECSMRSTPACRASLPRLQCGGRWGPAAFTQRETVSPTCRARAAWCARHAANRAIHAWRLVRSIACTRDESIGSLAPWPIAAVHAAIGGGALAVGQAWSGPVLALKMIRRWPGDRQGTLANSRHSARSPPSQCKAACMAHRPCWRAWV